MRNTQGEEGGGREGGEGGKWRGKGEGDGDGDGDGEGEGEGEGDGEGERRGVQEILTYMHGHGANPRERNDFKFRYCRFNNFYN